MCIFEREPSPWIRQKVTSTVRALTDTPPLPNVLPHRILPGVLIVAHLKKHILHLNCWWKWIQTESFKSRAHVLTARKKKILERKLWFSSLKWGVDFYRPQKRNRTNHSTVVHIWQRKMAEINNDFAVTFARQVLRNAKKIALLCLGENRVK